MDVWVLDQQENTLGILDTFESFIWTDRYRGYGDFELYMPVETSVLPYLKDGHRLSIANSDRMMIVEEREIDTDAEMGCHLTVTGRSLESILDRRVVWGHKILSGNFQNGIQTLLNENIIAPSNSARRIPDFIFQPSVDPRITQLTITTQFLGENLYEAIYSLCEEKEVGFRIRPNGAGGFIFELYCGVDHSYAQEIKPWVVFSPSFENLLTSNYLESTKALKTVSAVAGHGEGPNRVIAEAFGGAGWSGLDRRETFIDAADVSPTIRPAGVDEDGNRTEAVEMTQSEYLDQLAQKGREELTKCSVTTAFEGEIDASEQFVYRKDFDLGDVVQIINEYGMEATSRVSELVQAHDASGESVRPTFTATEKTKE